VLKRQNNLNFIVFCTFLLHGFGAVKIKFKWRTKPFAPLKKYNSFNVLPLKKCNSWGILPRQFDF